MLYQILIGVGAVIALGLILVAFRPKHYQVTRSLAMEAPPEVVFHQVNTLRNWEGWSPWAKLDPTMKQTYTGPVDGVGSKYEWQGNSKVGQGSMTIRVSEPARRIGIDLVFLKPFSATCDTQFTFDQNLTGTIVTWSMAGTNNYMAKLFGLIFNMNRLIGNDFEKGLQAMKTIVETQPS